MCEIHICIYEIHACIYVYNIIIYSYDILYIHILIIQALVRQEAMDLKKSGEGYIPGLGGKKGKGEM